MVEILLRSGLDVNIRTPAGTALHEAALCGKVEVVKTLLEFGCDPNIRDAHHYSVKDLLSQFPPNATHEIMGLLRSKCDKLISISSFHFLLWGSDLENNWKIKHIISFSIFTFDLRCLCFVK